MPPRDRHVQTATHEPRLSMRRVDGPSNHSELVVERGVVGLGGWDQVLGKELELETAIAAHEAEAPALALGARDGGAPVDLHAELAGRQPEPRRTGRERDRHPREPLGTPFQQLACLGWRQPADVHAGDVGSLGELVRRPREDETQEQGDQQREERENAEPGPQA